MKNLIKIITASIFALLSLNSYADENVKPEKLKKSTSVVDAYIESIALGNAKNSEVIFAEDFSQRVNGINNNKLNKKQIVKFLKSQNGYIQNCNSTYQLIESTDKYTIAKVEMVYENFTRTDYLHLNLNDGAWEIQQIETNYSK